MIGVEEMRQVARERVANEWSGGGERGAPAIVAEPSGARTRTERGGDEAGVERVGDRASQPYGVVGWQRMLSAEPGHDASRDHLGLHTRQLADRSRVIPRSGRVIVHVRLSSEAERREQLARGDERRLIAKGQAKKVACTIRLRVNDPLEGFQSRQHGRDA